MFDTTLGVLNIEVAEELDHVQLVFITGTHFPMGQNHLGEMQLMPIVTGIYRAPMGREAGIEHGTALLAAAERLPVTKPKSKSDLVVVGNMSGVDNLAREQENLRRGT